VITVISLLAHAAAGNRTMNRATVSRTAVIRRLAFISLFPHRLI